MSFFGSFFGKDQQGDITNANRQATGALTAGKTAALGNYSQAQGMYQPYAAQGGRANALYGDALGVNGAGARSAAMANFAQGNPYSQAGDDYAMQGVMRQMNARGMGSSGNALLAAQRVGSERFDNRFNTWMGQMQGAGQQGLQATGAMAGLQQGMGDIESGYGQQMAANAINFGNALASSRNIGTQNMLGLGGMLMQGFAPTATGATAFGNMAGAAGRAAQGAYGSVNKLWG